MIRFQIKPFSDLSNMPGTYPTPRKNHVRGMRRKAKVEGRKTFVISGKRRKV